MRAIKGKGRARQGLGKGKGEQDKGKGKGEQGEGKGQLRGVRHTRKVMVSSPFLFLVPRYGFN